MRRKMRRWQGGLKVMAVISIGWMVRGATSNMDVDPELVILKR